MTRVCFRAQRQFSSCRIWTSSSCGYEEPYLLRRNAVESIEINQRFGWTSRLHLQSRRTSQIRNQHEAGTTKISSLAYSSTLKMEATCSSETSVDFQRATLRYITEGKTLNLFFSPISRWSLGPNTASYIPELKRSEREARQRSPASAEIKKYFLFVFCLTTLSISKIT
jgi:hypothetical protein